MLARLRKYFLTGLIVTVPLAVTLYVTWLLVDGVDRAFVGLLPLKYEQLYDGAPFRIPGLGLVVSSFLLVFIGWLAAGVLGRYFLNLSEQIIDKMPVVRSVYSAIKQIFSTIFQPDSQAFSKVVIVEFPRPNCYALGFLTNDGKTDVDDKVSQDCVAVFLPTSPNPTSGYLLFFPREQIKFADMTVEEGLKLVISGGVASP